MAGRLATLLLSLIVGLAPLALGSNRALPWALNALLTGGAGLLTIAALWIRAERAPPLRLGLIGAALFLWTAALAWAFVQLIPLGASALAHPNWSLLAAVLGQDPGARISINPFETLQSITRLGTYAMLFISMFILARDPRNAAILLRAFTLFAGLYAVYGLARYSTGSAKILWFDHQGTGDLSSTFINRNSAATYFGLAAVASLALVMRRMRHVLADVAEGGTPRLRLETLARGMTGGLGLELSGFVLFLTTLLLTQSRAGVAACFAALVMGLILQRLRAGNRNPASGAIAVTMSLVLLAAFFAVVELAGARVTQRLMGTELAAEGRIGLFRDTLAAIADHAWMGTGLGTFQDIYPVYRSSFDASKVVWDKAHNDYLEALLGLGIPAGSALILGVAVISLGCLKGLFARRRNSHFALAACMASLLAGLHAFFDFSLQIQAVAMSFTLLLAVGLAQSASERG